MFRVIFYAILGIFAITFVRMVMGIIAKGFSDLMREEGSAGAKAPARSATVPTSGELKACQRCGTYIVASEALTRTTGGETSYYCSEKCKEAVAAASGRA